MGNDLVTVQITRETLNAIKNIAHELETQNNRATAKPYFLVIQTKKWRVANDNYTSGETKRIWVDTNDGDYREWSDPKEFMVDLVRNQGMTAKESKKYAEENLTEFTLEAYYEEDNIFLTDKGFEEHVRQNGHNLGRRGEYHTYMKHAFRNPEMLSIFNMILELGKQ